MPPVTGLASFGDGAAIEYEADLAGHWLDGDQLHIGRVRIEAGARVGTRSTLMGGACVGAGAEVAPGTCVDGTVPRGELWAGSAMERVGTAGEDWPPECRKHRRQRRVGFLYPLSLMLLALLPLLSVVPGGLLMVQVVAGIGRLETAL